MFTGNYKELALDNTNFRKVLETAPSSQIVAMSLKVNEDIGEEVHKSADQIFLIASGSAEIMVGDEKRNIQNDDIAIVPQGMLHNVTNIGDSELKLITIYAPPTHPKGTVQETK